MHTFFSSLRGGEAKGTENGNGNGNGIGNGNGVCDSPPPWALIHGTVSVGGRGLREIEEEERAAVACYCCHPCTGCRNTHSVTSLGYSHRRTSGRWASQHLAEAGQWVGKGLNDLSPFTRAITTL